MISYKKILAGLLAGAVLGLVSHLYWGGAPALDWILKNLTDPAGKIFLRLIFMLVIPIIFSAIALGVAQMDDLRTLGRVGLRTLIYTVAVSAVAVFIGIFFVNFFRPGDGFSPAVRADLLHHLGRTLSSSVTPPTLGIQFFIELVPDNPVAAAAGGQMLALMFFAVMFGVGMVLLPGEKTKTVREFLDGIFRISIRLIEMIMKAAPLGVGALLFTLTARFGWELLRTLGAYVLVVLAALAVHQFIVYSLILKYVGRTSPLQFFKKIRLVMLTAFSTSSSNVTLPTALEVGEKELKIKPHINNFVLTVGSTTNQNGTALFEGVTVLFLAQFFGIDLSLGAQILVVVLSILSGVGTAGVPSGSLPVIAALLVTVGIPAEGIGIILGVDRLLDMCRTTLNVTGDLAAAVVIDRMER